MEGVMALLEITVGLVLERLDSSSPWGEPIWRPAQVLAGVPDTPPWTVLDKGADRASYFAGAHTISLYVSHAGFYRDNLMAAEPKIWVAMQPDGPEPPVGILAVTVDPTEGEGYTETGTNVVEAMPMPDWLAGEIAQFVAEHFVERTFEKRKRDKRPPDLMGRRRPIDR
jgi:Protein of unknown function (DUF3305)